MRTIKIWAIKKGSQVANATPEEYLSQSTDEIFLKEISKRALESQDDIGVPMIRY